MNAERSNRGSASRAAPAVYVFGALVESLGLGLIAAYHWFLVGGVLAVGGFVSATIANLRWSGPEQGISVLALLQNRIADSTRPAPTKRAGTTKTATVGHSTERR
jgi:hypothetical protein